LQHRYMASSSAQDPLKNVVNAQLQAMHAAGTYKSERVLTGPQGSSISVQGLQQSVINLCTNNYLGLSNQPEVVKAAVHALENRGYGLSSVRFIAGTQDVHKELEGRISAFHGSKMATLGHSNERDTILYPSCFDANAGLFEVLLTSDDAVISDSLNHASIIDGIRLSKAQRFRYKHMDMADLEAQLQLAAGARLKLICTDGVFSMDGHIAPLPEILALAKKYPGTYTFVDECHATGVLGKHGRGTEEHFGVEGQVDIINSTLGKALGGATGGYTTGRKEVVELLRQRARPYLFSNTLAPAVAGGSLKVFDILEREGEQLLHTLQANTDWFRAALTERGFNLQPGTHPIVPVMLADAKLAAEMASRLLKEGVFVVAFSYPVVPKDQARIRCQISAAHTRDQLEYAAEAFARVGKELGVVA